MSEPGVIVLAVYRPDPSLLKRQLQSISDQSLGEWRCIIGIDGPDPAATSLVRGAIGDDSRFEVVEYPDNLGIYLHFERLLALISPGAPWFALADQDDYWHVSKLDALVATLDREGTSGASCQARLTTPRGIELGQTSRRAKELIPLLLVNEVTGCLSIFRTEVLEIAMPFPTPSNLAIHDHWLGVCAMSLSGFHVTDTILHDYVQHSGNAIGEKGIKSLNRALIDLLQGRESWKTITSDPWEWRVAMARTLKCRTSLGESKGLDSIARGKFTGHLLALMTAQSASGQVPIRVATALSIAAACRWRDIQLPPFTDIRTGYR
ncbi:glycosyltransferase [Terrabacter sp. RAF57]|uniref:glycosyltransferase n=1 Tax=Terrabacter sp. RAF57 TaxID=3233063 RepID=UPI003F96DC80